MGRDTTMTKERAIEILEMRRTCRKCVADCTCEECIAAFNIAIAAIRSYITVEDQICANVFTEKIDK